MRIVLSLIFGIVALWIETGCSEGQYVAIQSIYDTGRGIEVIIRLDDSRNVIEKILDVFNRSGLTILKLQQNYLSLEKEEIRINIKAGTITQLYELEYQLKCIVNVESVSIRR